MAKKSTILSVAEFKRYKELKHVVKTNSEAVWKFAEALTEIKEEELFRQEYEFFQDFLFAEIDLSKARAYQLINAVKFREKQKQLAERTGEAEVPETVKDATKMQQAAAPPPQSQEAQNEPAIPPSQPQKPEKTESTRVDTTQAAEPPKPVEKKEVLDLEVIESCGVDKMGFPLPKEIAHNFNQWHVTQRYINKLTDIKNEVEKLRQNKDQLFAHLTNTWAIDLNNIIFTLKSTMPYAVCPYCQGRNQLQCANCNHTGWVGKYFYERAVPVELRRLREIQIEKLKGKPVQ